MNSKPDSLASQPQSPSRLVKAAVYGTDLATGQTRNGTNYATAEGTLALSGKGAGLSASRNSVAGNGHDLIQENSDFGYYLAKRESLGRVASTARSEARTERSGAAQNLGIPHSEAGGNDLTPINNMGENWYEDDEEVGAVTLVLSDGKQKILMLRKPCKDGVAIIDWVNFTILEDTWFRTARERMVSDEEIICEASRYLEKIFGFGITAKRPNGMNFYRDSWVLGDDMGFVCFGGQRQTMLITLTGQGCANAVSGWEKRLYDFLTNVAVRPSISRVDLAHDDVVGAYLSVDWAEAQWAARGFCMVEGGRFPSIERVGNWHRPSGKGRTLTIGLRTSGKFCRFYEKGKKEGDKFSRWCRCEVEFKNSDRVIPFEILTAPSDFFAAAYPCFSEFVDVSTPQRMAIKQKTAQVVIEACIEVTKHQFGKYLRVFRDLYGDKAALDAVCNADKDAWPKRMKPLTVSPLTGAVPIHKQVAAAVLSFSKYLNLPSLGLNAEHLHAESDHYAMES